MHRRAHVRWLPPTLPVLIAPRPPSSGREGRLSTILAGLALALAVVALVAAFVLPGPAGGRGPAGPAGTPGVTGPQGTPGASASSLWAVVNANATLERGSGVRTVGFEPGGGYGVTFNESVLDCSYIATLGLGTSQGSQPAGMITVAGLYNVADGVYVGTFNSGGLATPEPFHLAVFCGTALVLLCH